MAEPNPCYPGTTYMITRRCLQRQFLLKPSDMVNMVFFWVLGLAALATGVKIHAVCVMSNHYHLIITDVAGRLPKFMGTLNKFVAAALNRFYGRRGYFFDGDGYDPLELTGPDAVLEYIVYTITNPVAAGLVDRIEKWPGAWLAPLGELAAPKPGVYFRKKKNPDLFHLRMSKPPGFEDMSDEEFEELLWARIRAKEEEIAEKFRNEKRGVLGSKKVLAQSHLDAPKTPDVRSEIKPRVAGKDKKRRIEILLRLKVFREAYKEALAQFREGVIDVVFPAGTWLMKQRFNVRCAEP